MPNVQARELYGLLGLGVDFGGKKIGTLQFTNGQDQDLKTHQGLLLQLGAYYQKEQLFGAQATIGYKFDSVNAKNGDVSFNRIPIEGLLFKPLENHRLGAGFTFHTNVNHKCDLDNICDYTLDFKNALGAVFQYDYNFKFGTNQNSMLIGARYTMIEYKLEAGGEAISGSGFGIFMGSLF